MNYVPDSSRYIFASLPAAGRLVPTLSVEARHDVIQSLLSYGKPANLGECSTFAAVNTTSNLYNGNTYNFYNNYDNSLHNEIWSSAMAGSFGTGMSWFWETIFWWEYGMPDEIKYGIFPFEEIVPVLTALGDVNSVIINPNLNPVDFINSTSFHQLKPLSDFIQSTDLSLSYESRIFTDAPNGIQAIYNIPTTVGYDGYGWVHNYASNWNSKWVMDIHNNYYVEGSICGSVASQFFTISGLVPNELYVISFYPTRMGGQTVPVDYPTMSVNCGNSGCIDVPISLGCDSTNSDYAFKINFHPLRLANPAASSGSPEIKTDILVYPNPASKKTTIACPITDTYACKITDISGKRVDEFKFSGTHYIFGHGNLAPGLYYLEVKSKNLKSDKKIIIE